MTEATTVAATVKDAVMPRPLMKPIPMSNMPRSEITTVVPANTTERPAVSMATTTDSRTVWPRCSCSRWRVTINSA